MFLQNIIWKVDYFAFAKTEFTFVKTEFTFVKREFTFVKVNLHLQIANKTELQILSHHVLYI